jgi:GR25 family glycosyltransferase involved in LPS biosynthesis
MILPFDKIYIINLVSNKERHNNCIKEFERIGVNKNDLNFWYATKNNFLNKIDNIIPTLKHPHYDKMSLYDKHTYNRIFNNTYNHYNIIKTSYERGFNSILVCEDDVNFIDDTNVVLDVFRRVPQDYDIIKFYNMCDNEFEFNKTDNIQYILEPNRGYLASAMIYALSKNGMKTYIDYIENNGLLVCDLIFEKLFNLCKLYSLDGKIIENPNLFESSLQNYNSPI